MHARRATILGCVSRGNAEICGWESKNTMRIALTVAVCVFLIAGASDAAAQVGQPWTDRGYVNLNAGFESTSGEFTDARSFRLYDEDGSIRIAQAVDSG